MLSYLSRPDNVERLTASADGNRELAAVREQIAAITGELNDLAEQVGRGKLSATLAARAEPAIQARLDAARERERELTTPSALRDLIKPGVDVRRRWMNAPMSAKREVARLLLTEDVLGELRVGQSPSPGHTAPVTEHVIWRTAEGVVRPAGGGVG